MNKQLTILLIFLLAIGVASAVDFETNSVTITTANPRANTDTVASMVFTLADSSGPVDMPVKIDFGNGLVLSKEYTLQPGSNTIITSVKYETAGNYLITVTADASNLITETNEGNNIITKTVTVNGAAVSGIFSTADVELGSSTQRRETTTNGNVRITNTESTDITVTLSSNLPSEYNLNFGQTEVTVPANSFTDVPVTISVPDTEDSGRRIIGTYTARSGSTTKSSSIYLTVKSELSVYKVKVETEDKSKSFSDGGTMSVKPGDTAKLTITVKNDFDQNIDINSVTLSVDGDSDLDLSEDTDLNDLSDGEKDSADFTFDIPTDSDGDQNIDIKVEGEDDNGAKHEDTYKISLNVEKKTHEIRVDTVTVYPTTISCGGKISIKTKVENTGSRDEDDATIIIKNEDIGLYQRWNQLDILEGDTLDRSYSFTVKDNVMPGDYLIYANTYYSGDRDSDDSYATLTVGECQKSTGSGSTSGNSNTGSGSSGSTAGSTGTQTGQTGNSGTGNTVTPPVIIPSGSSGPSYGESSVMGGSGYVIILVLAAVVMLVLILVLLFKFVF